MMVRRCSRPSCHERERERNSVATYLAACGTHAHWTVDRLLSPYLAYTPRSGMATILSRNDVVENAIARARPN